MRKTLCYADAAKLLGARGPLLTRLSRLAGAGLSVASAGGSEAALSLFDLKGEVVQFGEGVAGALRDRIIGLDRFRRSELLEAAHAVLVVTAFFAALDELDERMGSALNTASLELTIAEQAGLAAGPNAMSGSRRLAFLAETLLAPNVIPGIGAGWKPYGNDLEGFYVALTNRVSEFAAGVAAWDERDEAVRNRWLDTLCRELPARAVNRYEERLHQLAGEFPEFAFWAHRVGVRAVLDQLHTVRQESADAGAALHSVIDLIRAGGPQAVPDKVRADLATGYRGLLDRPVAGAGDIPDEVTLPTLRELYVNPSFRVLGSRITWGDEFDWRATSPCRDLLAFVVSQLLSTETAHAPMVLLGQPGAGKSVFTQVLAAELDPNDYLVVRVELRSVASDAGIQRQVESALEALTGRTLPWPELAEQAGTAQPVIVLDGFDELLQASGVSQFDFLERVQEFQEREASLGRPVAVLVTSRTAVADQVRYPDEAIVLQLDEFDDDQVESWLTTWNEANQVRPLPPATALAQGELARQPLLLFLLALFHSGGGALTTSISRAELYERLFVRFAERDVAKRGSQGSDRHRRHAVRRELDLLSMVAFAMFNRGQQSVTETDLIADFAVLPIEGQPFPEPRQQALALTTAQHLAGRFFFKLFVQRAQAMQGHDTRRSTYEFLHASFGEFLVARWVVGELSRLAEQVRRTADDLYPAPADDARLHSLLSFAVLSTREQRVLDFVADLLTTEPATHLAELRTLVATMFRGCLQPRKQDPYPGYRPVQQTAPASYAAYSANLVLLLLLVAQAQSKVCDNLKLASLPLDELFGSDLIATGAEQQRALWHSVSRLWHAQLGDNEWHSLLDVVRLMSLNSSATDAPPQMRITRWSSTDFNRPASGLTLLSDMQPLDPQPASEHSDQVWLYDPIGLAIRETALLGCPRYLDACTALLSYVGALGLYQSKAFQLGSLAADTIALAVHSASEMPADQRIRLYLKLLNSPTGWRRARLLLNRLRDDIHWLLTADLSELMSATQRISCASITAYLDIITQLYVAEQLNPLHLRNLLDLSRDLSTGAGLAAPISLLNEPPVPPPAYGFELDRGNLLDFCGLLDLPDIPELFDLIDQPDVIAEFHLLPVLGDLLELRGRPAVRNLTRLTNIRAATEFVLWFAIAERGLPVGSPPRLPPVADIERLNTIAPHFVARARQLARDRSYANPSTADPTCSP